MLKSKNASLSYNPDAHDLSDAQISDGCSRPNRENVVPLFRRTEGKSPRYIDPSLSVGNGLTLLPKSLVTRLLTAELDIHGAMLESDADPLSSAVLLESEVTAQWLRAVATVRLNELPFYRACPAQAPAQHQAAPYVEAELRKKVVQTLLAAKV